MDSLVKYIEHLSCVIISYPAITTCKDILAALHAIDKYAKRGRQISGVLADYSHVSRFEVSSEDIERIAAETVKTSKSVFELLVAVVAPQPFIFGASRMWEVYAKDSGWIMDTFKTKDAASSWLTKQLGIKSICAE